MTVMIRPKCILVSLSVMIFTSRAASDHPVTKDMENSIIDEIEVLLSIQNERIQTLENIVSSQKTEIQNIRREVSNLKSKDRIKERKLLRLADIFVKSSKTMAATTEVYKNDLKMAEIQKKDVSLIDRKRLLEGNILTTPIPTKKAVTTFYAYLSKNENVPGIHHTHIFDTVITNENNGYDPFTGTFIAPGNGINVFTFNLRLHGQSYGPYEIVKNAKVVGVVNSDTRQVSIQYHIAGTNVIPVNKGDDIFVRTHATSPHSGVIISDNYGRSSFAGWLISN